MLVHEGVRGFHVPEINFNDQSYWQKVQYRSAQYRYTVEQISVTQIISYSKGRNPDSKGLKLMMN